MDNSRSEISTEVRELRARAAEQLSGNEYYMISQQLDSLENSPELTGETAQSVLEMLRARLGLAEGASPAADSAAAASGATEPESASGNQDHAVITPRANSFGMPQATGAISFASEPEGEGESGPDTAGETAEPAVPPLAMSRLQAAAAATHRLATEHLDGNRYYMAANLLDGLRNLPAADRKGESITVPESLDDAVALLRQEIEQLGSIAKDQAAPMVVSLQALFAPDATPEVSAADPVEDAAAAAKRETMEALASLRAEDETADVNESTAPEASPSEPAVDEQVVSIAQPALDAAAAAKRETMEALASLRADLDMDADSDTGAVEETAPEPAKPEETASVVEVVSDAAATARRETMEALSGLRADIDPAPSEEIAEPETEVAAEAPAASEDADGDRQETMAAQAGLRDEPEADAETAADVSDDAVADDQVEPVAAAAEAEPEIAAAETEEPPEAEPEPAARTGFDDLADAAWQRVRQVGHDDVAIALNGSAVHARVVSPSSPAPRPAPAAPPPPAAAVQETPAPSVVPPVVEEPSAAAPAPAAPDVEARRTDEALHDGGSERRSSETDNTAEHDVPAAASGDPEPAAETAATEARPEAGEAAPPAETVAVETPEAAQPRNAETSDSAAATATAALENIARTEAPLVADEERIAPDMDAGEVAAEAVETASEAGAEAVAAVEAAMETVAKAEVQADVETASATEPSAEPVEAKPVAEEAAVSPVETVAAEAAAQQEADTAPPSEPEPIAASAEQPKPAAPETQKQPEKPASKGFFARLFGR